MRSESFFQGALIVSGIVATVLFAIFFNRELYPEYRIYQDRYIALEKFRSSYTHESPSSFKEGVKQIIIEKEDKGPPVIDRCISCHVALQIEDFSPTKIARDVNGNIVYDSLGRPVQEDNPNYIWNRLQQEIDTTEDLSLKEFYTALKTARVGEKTYNIEKVLRMHPLIGRETRPFEYHPLEEYGCTSCHGGNGRGLVTDRSHGPVFDGHYEVEYRGFIPEFLEKDENNDPPFSRVFNAKPGGRLLFQTTPIYPGNLIEAKCIQCHQSTADAFGNAKEITSLAFEMKKKELLSQEKALQLEEREVASLLTLQNMIKELGFERALESVESKEKDYTLPSETLENLSSQLKFLKGLPKENVPTIIHQKLLKSLGSENTIARFAKAFSPQDPLKSVEDALNKEKKDQRGTLFEKWTVLNASKELQKHIEDVSESLEDTLGEQEAINAIQTDVDVLTKTYQKGQQLFLSQSCYACHRISGFSRGGVGPELTRSGDSYPWHLKESIVWPQGDLKTSTMPNMRLDHEEVEALMTFLLAQTSRRKSLSETNYKMGIQQWEAGKKLPWETDIPKEKIEDINYGMTLFAVEGCASCHRLRGYESDVGFAVEKGKNLNFQRLEEEVEWFKKLFPEDIKGSQIAKVVEEHQEEIDKRIVDNVREGSLIEKMEKTHPGTIEALYSNFKFASRIKNQATSSEIDSWKARINRVLKIFIKTYGLGRLICPKPSWSGVYRGDQWLIEHFQNPSSHVPRSIMPAFPFNESKFYALTYMLDKVGEGNVLADRKIWEEEGFNPAKAFAMYCVQCHGNQMRGDGPVSEWIYPIPKNLKRPDFLRQLTKERAVQSIIHGVKGTPMPSWGELGEDKPFENKTPVMNEKEIRQLVDWLFSFLPGESIIRSEAEVPKWNYKAENVIAELKEERNKFPSKESEARDSQVPTEEGIFDKLPNRGIGPEKEAYFIKEKYYTEQNIEAGRRFFIENCAQCHGKEADGTGPRAETMGEAKPRMLTNLDWINTRDDLRLLRSIKYGVPGTSMTPWGDLTSSLQRLQLVVFIRHLSKTKKERRALTDALYESFDRMDFLIKRAFLKEADGRVKALTDLIRKEKETFFAIGIELMSVNAPASIQEHYLELIEMLQNQYQIKGDKLLLEEPQGFEIKFQDKFKKLVDEVDQQLENIERKKEIVEGEIGSPERILKLNSLNASIATWEKIKVRLINGFAEFRRSREKEKQYLLELNKS